MDRNHSAVADTALLVAAMRARETARADRLFSDPFAARLAGERGRELLAAAAAQDQSSAQIVVRTRFWDEALLRSARRVRQVVLVAAGMDARAYRLPWPDCGDPLRPATPPSRSPRPDCTVVYELDQREVMSEKARLLADQEPRCRRVEVGVDLADDWPGAVRAAGFDPAQPSVWLAEGLLQYLDEAAVGVLFDRIDALSTPGSVLLYDVVGRTLLESPMMAGVLKSMAEQGAPWLFGTDDPAQLARRHGWTASVTDIAEPGNRYHRWYAPAVPMDVSNSADVPRGYFVEARK